MTDNPYEYRYLVELRQGEPHRQIDADGFNEIGDWMIFHRKPPQGGIKEYWRVRMTDVVCMETKR